jgi:hypothetical protein
LQELCAERGNHANSSLRLTTSSLAAALGIEKRDRSGVEYPLTRELSCGLLIGAGRYTLSTVAFLPQAQAEVQEADKRGERRAPASRLLRFFR